MEHNALSSDILVVDDWNIPILSLGLALLWKICLEVLRYINMEKAITLKIQSSVERNH